MQSQPKKGPRSQKSIHAEQQQKLQSKHQHEIELLEDLRLFSKQRSTIEKEYAQALCKLSQQFLSKRSFHSTPDLPKDGNKVMSEVWKSVLVATDRIGKIRLQAADTYMQHISEPIKPIKTAKVQVAKKVFEQVTVLQKELTQSMTEMQKTQKAYTEEEHITHEARTKAAEAEAKVEKKSTGLFTSLAKLQQNCSKLTVRRDACEVKSTMARNDYLLNLSSTNAHMDQYYGSDLPLLIQMLDGEMFEKVQEFFTIFSKTEVDCCGLTQESFMKILSDSTLISRNFNLQCFLHENQVFSEKMQYQFEAQENDQISLIDTNHNALDSLEKEAERLCTSVKKDNHIMRKHNRQILQLQRAMVNGSAKSESKDGATSPTTPLPHDNEVKIEDLRQEIRRAETGKRKAESRLEAMKHGGMNIDKWMDEVARADAEDEATDDRASIRSSISADTTSNSNQRVSVSVAEEVESSQPKPASAPIDSTYINYQEDDFDETFVTDAAQTRNARSSVEFPITAIALYDFEGSNPDELGIQENEALEVLGEGDSQGWWQARNAAGDLGLVPQNYIQLGFDQNEMNVDGDLTNGVDQVFESAPPSAGYESSAPPSAGYSPAAVSSTPTSAGYDSTAPVSAGFDSVPPSAGYNSAPPPSSAERVSTYSSTDYEVQENTTSQDAPSDGQWVRALYDYEATCDEELTFQEGQLIHILRRDGAGGVDDGWWEGELNGQVGVFPSLVVEEITGDVDHVAELHSPDRPGPPAFTPPEPGPPPPQLAVDPPTPIEETSPQANGEQSQEDAAAVEKHEDAELTEATENGEVETLPDAPPVCENEDPNLQEVLTVEVHSPPDGATNMPEAPPEVPVDEIREAEEDERADDDLPPPPPPPPLEEDLEEAKADNANDNIKLADEDDIGESLL